MTRYTRQDVLRILHLRARQLTAWEREGLIPAAIDGEQYSFEHLSRLRALREMRSKRMTARSIRAQGEATQKVAGTRNVLVEAGTAAEGGRVACRQGGALMEPLSQQLAFDFGLSLSSGLRTAARVQTRHLKLVEERTAETSLDSAEDAARVQEMFVRAVQLEESTTTLDDAVELYQDILVLRQDHAPACINLGTIYYNRREFGLAENMYRRATEADPHYALAFFDLGNVLDERQRMAEAILAYQRAIEIVPGYADAHYNLALAFERQGERRRALRHWMAYMRLDPVGPWAAHAKGQARKILGMEKLRIVSRSGRKVAS